LPTHWAWYDFAVSENFTATSRSDGFPVDENPRLILGLKIRTLRHDRGETLQTVANRSALSVSYLSEIEKGKKYPKPERLMQLAGALEVPFDDLVSLQVADELTQLKAAFSSPLLRGFPYQLFGLEPEDLMALVSGDPARGSALLRAVSEVGRSYDVHVEHFLLAALRAYQHLRANYFDDLESEAGAFKKARGWESLPAGSMWKSWRRFYARSGATRSTKRSSVRDPIWPVSALCSGQECGRPCS
jgi:transcriptional regulator with XRE-family HTH domain